MRILHESVAVWRMIRCILPGIRKSGDKPLGKHLRRLDVAAPKSEDPAEFYRKYRLRKPACPEFITKENTL